MTTPLVLDITPVPKPRMVQSDKWKKRPATERYFRFVDQVRSEVRGTLESRFEVVFRLPMPKSWSAKKKAAMDGRPHQQRPDVDNLCKAIMDALCKEDSHVYDVRMSKYWASTGAIELTERID